MFAFLHGIEGIKNTSVGIDSVIVNTTCLTENCK